MIEESDKWFMELTSSRDGPRLILRYPLSPSPRLNQTGYSRRCRRKAMNRYTISVEATQKVYVPRGENRRRQSADHEDETTRNSRHNYRVSYRENAEACRPHLRNLHVQTTRRPRPLGPAGVLRSRSSICTFSSSLKRLLLVHFPAL